MLYYFLFISNRIESHETHDTITEETDCFVHSGVFNIYLSLHTLFQAGALAQHCRKGRVTQAAGEASPGAPALLAELQDAGLGEGAVILTLKGTCLHLVSCHAAAVFRPGHSDAVRVKALSYTHHTDITLRKRGSRWGQQKQGRRGRCTSYRQKSVRKKERIKFIL